MNSPHTDEFALNNPGRSLTKTGNGLVCEIVSDFRDLLALEWDWTRLWESDERAEFFQSFEWARAWWEAFGDSVKLCTPVVFRGGDVSLIVPLVQEGDTVRILGSPQCDYGDALCLPESEAELLTLAFRTLLDKVPGWRECALDHLHPDGHIVKVFSGIPDDLRRLMRLDVSDGCPTISFGGRRETVLGTLLAGKHLRRRLNKLKRMGRVNFRHLEDRQEAHRHLSRFFRCHRRRCAALAKTSCFDDPAMRGMLRTLVDQLDLQEELRFGVLEVNDRPVAWSIGFQSHGKYSYYQQTFDIDAEEYAPGEVLLRFLLEYARDSVDREFDFLRGDEFFKKRYATQITQSRRLYLQRKGVAGKFRLLKRFAEGGLRRAGKRIEDFARTRESVFHSFRSLWMWKRNVQRRMQWASEHEQAGHYLWNAFWLWFRRKLWTSGLSTLFRVNVAEALSPSSGARLDPGTSIGIGRLSDLADLALEFPGIPFPNFREYRKRLKRGDKVYLVCRNGELALVAWAGSAASGGIQKSAKAIEQRPVLALYECWPIYDAGTACAELLKSLATQASERGADLLVSCPTIPPSSARALEQSGFVPQCEMESSCVLGWHTSARVHGFRANEEGKQNETSCPKMGHVENCG